MRTSGERESLDDYLDRLVGEYSDVVSGGGAPSHDHYLALVPAEARPGLERCLKMIDAGLAQAPSAGRPLAPGTTFGRYRLLRELGRGGMALVWLAHDSELRRPVALKLLRPGLALEARHVDRFRREALAIAKLQHPHIVRVYDVGQEHGFHFLAMEYLEGPSLATVLEALPEKHGWTADELTRVTGNFSLGPGHTFEQAAAALLAPVAEVLHAAHQQGLVHRDVKPSNILLRADGSAVVADFGLAKGEGDPALSITGDTLGTPYYMSPEQAWLSESKVDHRTDVYSLGVTLYELLTGERPFEGDNVLEVFEKIKTLQPPSPRSREHRVTKDANAVVRKAMARDPEGRFDTSLELYDDLTALARGEATQARRSQGSLLQRSWTQMRVFCSGQPYEFRSRTTLFGLPLVHLISGRRYPGQPVRAAKGWLAMGDVAVGGIAFGGAAAGVFAFGGMVTGLFTMGGLSLALLVSGGGISVGGLLSCGGISGGYLAAGGMAFGYAVIGGYTHGVWAMGGSPHGRNVWIDGESEGSEGEFFRAMMRAALENLGID